MQWKVKVKCILVQALRLCTGRTAHRGSRGIALPFLDQRHQKGMRGLRYAPTALYSRERPGTHCTEGQVSPRARLDRCGKSRRYRDSISGPSSPQPVPIPTTLPGPQHAVYKIITMLYSSLVFFVQLLKIQMYSREDHQCLQALHSTDPFCHCTQT